MTQRNLYADHHRHVYDKLVSEGTETWVMISWLGDQSVFIAVDNRENQHRSVYIHPLIKCLGWRRVAPEAQSNAPNPVYNCNCTRSAERECESDSAYARAERG